VFTIIYINILKYREHIIYLYSIFIYSTQMECNDIYSYKRAVFNNNNNNNIIIINNNNK